MGLMWTRMGPLNRTMTLATRKMWGVCVCVWVAQLCPTLCKPMDCSLPGSSVHGILQARILEWAAIPFSRGSSQPKDWTQVSWTANGSFTIWTTTEAQNTGWGVAHPTTAQSNRAKGRWRGHRTTGGWERRQLWEPVVPAMSSLSQHTRELIFWQ